MSNLLEGFTIVDFSHRLPGPLAGNLLGGLGAKVYKVEDHKFKDAFLNGLFAEMDESFVNWYELLNNNKELKRYDFKSEEDLAKIKELALSADAILMGLPPKIQNALGLTKEELSKLDKPIAVIEMGASENHKSAMHDLNALAMTGLLKLHVDGRSEDIVDPPFMPMAGIAFGNKLATDLLAAMLKARKENKVVFAKTYLYEATEEIFSPFWPKKMRAKKQTRFLHNGIYPCYSLYKLKSNDYVALAAVEEKFWLRFCEVFKLDIPAEKRFFHEDQSVFKMISNRFLEYSREEIKNILENEDFCLSLV